jgi:hypothetical protein
MKNALLIFFLFCCTSAIAQTYKLGLRFGVQYNQLYDVGPNYSVQYVPNYEFMLSENVLRKWNWSLQFQQGFSSHFYIATNNNTGEEFFNPRTIGYVMDFTLKKNFFGRSSKQFIFAPYFGLRYYWYYKNELVSSYAFGFDVYNSSKFQFYLSCHVPLSLYDGLPDKYDLTTYQLWGSERFVISAGIVYKIIPMKNE